MKAIAREPLVLVWALLIAVTVMSWLTARDGGAAHRLDLAVTVTVLLIAALKAQLVIWHFMEVRRAPAWLKLTTTGWVVVLFGVLLVLYCVQS